MKSFNRTNVAKHAANYIKAHAASEAVLQSSDFQAELQIGRKYFLFDVEIKEIQERETHYIGGVYCSEIINYNEVVWIELAEVFSSETRNRNEVQFFNVIDLINQELYKQF